MSVRNIRQVGPTAAPLWGLVQQVDGYPSAGTQSWSRHNVTPVNPTPGGQSFDYAPRPASLQTILYPPVMEYKQTTGRPMMQLPIPGKADIPFVTGATGVDRLSTKDAETGTLDNLYEGGEEPLVNNFTGQVYRATPRMAFNSQAEYDHYAQEEYSRWDAETSLALVKRNENIYRSLESDGFGLKAMIARAPEQMISGITSILTPLIQSVAQSEGITFDASVEFIFGGLPGPVADIIIRASRGIGDAQRALVRGSSDLIIRPASRMVAQVAKKNAKFALVVAAAAAAASIFGGTATATENMASTAGNLIGAGRIPLLIEHLASSAQTVSDNLPPLQDIIDTIANNAESAGASSGGTWQTLLVQGLQTVGSGIVTVYNSPAGRLLPGSRFPVRGTRNPAPNYR